MLARTREGEEEEGEERWKRGMGGGFWTRGRRKEEYLKEEEEGRRKEKPVPLLHNDEKPINHPFLSEWVDSGTFMIRGTQCAAPYCWPIIYNGSMSAHHIKINFDHPSSYYQRTRIYLRPYVSPLRLWSCADALTITESKTNIRKHVIVKICWC